MLRENKGNLQYVLYVDVNESGLFLFNELLLMIRSFLSLAGVFADKRSSSAGDLPPAAIIFFFQHAPGMMTLMHL